MPVLIGLLCAATWAGGSIMIRDLSRKLDPFTLNAPRAMVGGLAMFLLSLATGRTQNYHTLTPEKLLFLLSSIGVGGGIGDSFYVLSLARIGVSRAFPIASIYPAITLLFGLTFLQEKVTLAVGVGMALVLAGILLISRPSKNRGAPLASGLSAPGVIFALIAALCWAASMVLIAPGIQGLDEIMVASVHTCLVSAVVGRRGFAGHCPQAQGPHPSRLGDTDRGRVHRLGSGKRALFTVGVASGRDKSGNPDLDLATLCVALERCVPEGANQQERHPRHGSHSGRHCFRDLRHDAGRFSMRREAR